MAEHSDRYRNVIGIFMNQVLYGQPMTVFGDGRQTRAFSYIDDVAPLIARAPLVSAAVNGVFNVGVDTPYTILQLTDEIAMAFGVERKVQHLPARTEVVHAFSDHSRVRNVFKPPSPTDLRTGIRRMAEWVKNRGPAVPVRFSEIEVRKNLHLRGAIDQKVDGASFGAAPKILLCGKTRWV